MSEPSSEQSAADVDTASVGRLVERLRALHDLPVAEHAGVYQEVHAQLQAALADIDSR